jgi:uncharacterized protein YbjT (DUF2867 family)
MQTKIDIQDNPALNQEILVLGSSGKTGRRIAFQLQELGHVVRKGGRSATPSFDWHDRSGWKATMDGVRAIYIAYYPDLASPGAADNIEALIEVAREVGVEKLVLLSGRGEEEAQRCERLVLGSGIPATVVRAAWFHQNFSENFIREMVMDEMIALPVGTVKEPFVDARDIAEVAVAALTEDGHEGEMYEVTGPELLSFDQVASELSEATGRPMRFLDISHEEYMEGVRSAGLPGELTELIDYLFREVLDGRNETLCDGVERALGRPPRSFRKYAREAAAEGVWNH